MNCTPGWRVRIAAILLLLTLSLTATGCTITWNGELNREAGRQAREQVDQLLQQLGEFVAGFCSGAALPLAAAGVVLARRRNSGR